jgi:hypothetical protein
MKKIPVLVTGALLALFLIGCPNNDGTDTDTEDDSHTGKVWIRRLEISNQSSIYIWDVRWYSTEFDKGGFSPPDMTPWPEGYHGWGLNTGEASSKDAATGVGESPSPYSSYIYFKFTIGGASGSTYSARTQELVVVDDDPVEFKITDNTVVVRSEGESYTGTLSGLVSLVNKSQ